MEGHHSNEKKKKPVQKKKSPLTLFVYRYYFRNYLQPLCGAPILIIHYDLEHADRMILAEDNELADSNINGTGYKCIKTVALNKPMNLNLTIGEFHTYIHFENEEEESDEKQRV